LYTVLDKFIGERFLRMFEKYINVNRWGGLLLGLVTIVLYLPMNTRAAEPVVTSGRIVFSSGRNSSVAIYLMDTNGQNLKRLAGGKEGGYHPVWSPDGQKLAFISERYGYQQIYVMDADGQNQQL